jgi:tripartite ATP-independent transporter DctP family solute receptor
LLAVRPVKSFKKERKMKKILVVLAILVVIGAMPLAAGGGQDSAGGKVIDLKLNITTNDTSAWTEGARKFKSLVESRAPGRYIVSIYPNEQLAAGDQTGTMAMLYQDSGIIDVDVHSAMIHSNQVAELAVCFMPWIFSKGSASVDEILFADNATGGKVIMDAIAKKGPVPLALGENGFRQFTNNKLALKTPADFKNLKMRVPSVPVLTDLYRMLGTDPTTMSMAEVFTALQNGTIDGQENPLDVINSYKLNEVQKFLTIGNYCYDPIVLSVSNKRWTSFSADDQKLFKQAAVEAMKYQVQYNRDAEKKVVANMKAAGMQVNELSAEQVAAFQTALAPLYKQYIAKFGPEIFAAFGYKAQ